MSNSSNSLINPYLTNKNNTEPSGPPPPEFVLKQTGFKFPNNLTNYQVVFDALPKLQIAQFTGQSPSWKNGYYDIRTSTYRVHNNIYYPPARWYNTLVSTSDFNRLPQHNTHGYVKYDGSEVTGNYGQVAYTGGNYQGGLNPGQYFTTTYDTGSADGEFLQWGFPFYLKMTQFKLRARNNDQQIKGFTLVGSNDNGATWFFIDTGNLTNVNAGQWQSRTVSTAEKYKLFRVIGRTIDNLQDWSYCQAECTGDAYTYE
jgi:hypothetical protein